MRGRSAVAVAVAAAAAVAATAGCGGSGGVSRAEVVDAVGRRERVDAAAADCIAGYALAAYDDDELEVILDDGVTGLPASRWFEYTHAVAACGLAADVDVPLPRGR